ncbi:hypothetical protein DPMN_060913 [Dreissena polymorpha]|uniref:Uncharacterized protein n=1 Tax=Dreissena polymorpha TaxID=45954 RepID=A0A9D4HHX9_DREPO|nr:hypothetical protein DPMN_060913 [Dreissena polymorpha]
MLKRNITNNINYKTPLVTAPVPVTSSPVLVSSLTSLPNPPPYPGCELWVSQAGQQQPRLEINKYSIGFTRPFETINSESVSSVAMEERHDRPPANPLLATLLDAGSPAAVAEIPSSQSIISDSPMLSKLLEENTSVATNPFPPPNHRKRVVKRKSSKDVTAAGKSPKHRVSESEMVEQTSERTNHERHGQGLGEKHIDLDSSGGSYDDPMRPPSASSVCSLGPQSDGSVIDLTDSFGESHVKKLENSLDSFINKESPHSAMGLSHQLNQMNNQFSSFEDLLGFNIPDFTNPNQNHPNATNPMLLDGGMDFQTPQPQWVSRQTPPTTNSRGSPHHGVLPKNEKTSTSLEDLLQGPRGREKDGPSPVMHMRQNLQQHKRQNFKQRHGRNSVESSGGVSPDGFSPLMTSPSHHPLASPGGQFPMPSPTGYIISPGSVPPMMSPSHSSNLTSPVLSHVKSEPFLLDPKTGLQSVPHPNAMRLNYSFGHGHVPTGGKPSLSMLKAQLEQRNDPSKCNTSAILQERDLVLKDEVSNSSNNSSGSQTPTVKLKLMNLNRVLESGVSNSDSEEKSRTSAFDFHSDDEDFDLPMVEKITVVSASPTRLQISNKSTLASFNKFNRSEKRKQKEKALKNALSVDSGKRKRDREDKKEKKRKKINSYQGDEEVVYKSIAVEVGGDDEKPVMPKLKILKKSGKISVLSSLDVKEEKVEAKSSYVAQGKDITVSDWNEHKNTIDKDVVVNVEQIGKVLKKSDCAKGVKEKDTRHRDVEKSSDKLGIPISRTPSASDEGIFDRINAMKSESLGKNEDSNSSLERKPGSADNSPNLNHKKVSKSSSSSSSKSQKSHKRSSSSSKTDPKMKTPTIKLKQISLPTSTSSSVKVPKTPTTPGMPATPKNLSHSPTSTTIGKIGAVSLATSGSQKQLSGSSSKSPQGSSSGGKSSSRNSSSSLSKSSSSLQKSIQIQGPSGKNSPVPQSKSGHSRSLSSSGAILNSGTSKSDKLSKSLSSSNRTSSPLLEKEKSRSKSSSRDREKSTSSSKSATTPSTTPDTAADLLSFLNPKANKIASFTIPKLSSNVNTQKASTPTTSATVSIVSPTTAVTSTTTSASIVVNSVAKLSKPGSNVGKSAANSVGKTENALNKSNANRPHNLNVSITSNNSKGVNSPNSFSQRSNSVHNKSNNPNHNNQSPGFRNNGSSNNNKLSGSINNVTHSQKPGILSNGTTNQMGPLKGNSPLNGGGSKPNSASDSAMRGNPNVTNNNTNSRPPTSLVPNAPKGPGPPNSKSDSSTNFSQSDSSTKTKPDSQSPGSVKVRKGSLSAVIDKLTCKASGPVPASASSSSQTGTPVCIEEPPASPDMDSDAASEAKPAKVVVISEAPASPELDTPCSPECGVIRASRIISIPLENEPQNKGDEISSPTPSPKSLSFPDKITGPKIIPLNSVKEFAKNSSLNSSSNTKTDHFNPVSQQNGYLTNHSEALIGSNRGNNLHEPYAKDFKVPTPTKMLENSEPLRHNVVDFENLGVRRRSRSGSKASTPSSPPSSPENGLIIDFPVSPQLNLKSNSPYKVEKSGTDILRTSPNHVISPLVKMPSKLHMSSGSSPANGENASASSNENSPAFIEDDLMDEALGLGT